ncbi:hypothetical protein IG631_12649 [Alternaria alternata]|nr:hypothetical protein IG631_12649 [Alternaria alternata]
MTRTGQPGALKRKLAASLPTYDDRTFLPSAFCLSAGPTTLLSITTLLGCNSCLMTNQSVNVSSRPS